MTNKLPNFLNAMYLITLAKAGHNSRCRPKEKPEQVLLERSKPRGFTQTCRRERGEQGGEWGPAVSGHACSDGIPGRHGVRQAPKSFLPSGSLSVPAAWNVSPAAVHTDVSKLDVSRTARQFSLRRKIWKTTEVESNTIDSAGSVCHVL